MIISKFSAPFVGRRFSVIQQPAKSTQTTHYKNITPVGKIPPPFLLLTITPPATPPCPWIIFGYTGHDRQNSETIRRIGFNRSTFTSLSFEYCAHFAGISGRVFTVGMPIKKYISLLETQKNQVINHDKALHHPNYFMDLCHLGTGIEPGEYLTIAKNDWIFYRPLSKSIVRDAEILFEAPDRPTYNTPIDFAIFSHLQLMAAIDAENSLVVKYGIKSQKDYISRLDIRLPNGDTGHSH